MYQMLFLQSCSRQSLTIWLKMALLILSFEGLFWILCSKFPFVWYVFSTFKPNNKFFLNWKMFSNSNTVVLLVCSFSLSWAPSQAWRRSPNASLLGACVLHFGGVSFVPTVPESWSTHIFILCCAAIGQ